MLTIGVLEQEGMRRTICDIFLLVFHLVLSSFTFKGVDIDMADKIVRWNLKRYPEGQCSCPILDVLVISSFFFLRYHFVVLPFLILLLLFNVSFLSTIFVRSTT
jgi:hypothetical protein